MFKQFQLVAAGLALLAMTTSLQAKQVQLDVSMANPSMIAGQKQTTHLKVGLIGFELDSQKQRPPVNVSIVLDKSGSMQGEKIEQARAAAIAAVQRLSSRDIVSIVAYDSTVKVIVPSTKLTDKEAVIQRIREIQANGSTALFAGVSKGAEEIRKFLDKEKVNRVILLSDGLANVGPQSPSELGELGKSLSKEGISVSTMGLGLGYNEDLMMKLANRSGGNHVFIEHADALVRIFNYEFDDVLSVVAQEVSIEVKVAEGIRPVRVLNCDAEINGQQVIVQLNQLYSKQEKYLLLEVELPAGKPDQQRRVATVDVSYANMQTKTTDHLSSSVNVNFTESTAEVEKKANKEVMEATVLQIANEQNELATALRDKGEVEKAKQVLLQNGDYLNAYSIKLDSELLKLRCADNREQAAAVEGKDWGATRKSMRYLQNADAVQQRIVPQR
jgi:Ca-activated chloride channel homolog